MRIVGLTGGVASGKTEVAVRFLELRVPVIDTDRIARDLLTSNAKIRRTVEKELGTTDRRSLRQFIFRNPEARAKLQAILHPEIEREVQNEVIRFTHFQPEPDLVIVAVPLLYEVGWDKKFDTIVAVVTDRREQLERLKRRDQVDVRLAQQMIDSQMPNSEKAQRAHYVLHNDGSLEDLRAQVDLLYRELKTGD